MVRAEAPEQVAVRCPVPVRDFRRVPAVCRLPAGLPLEAQVPQSVAAPVRVRLVHDFQRWVCRCERVVRYPRVDSLAPALARRSVAAPVRVRLVHGFRRSACHCEQVVRYPLVDSLALASAPQSVAAPVRVRPVHGFRHVPAEYHSAVYSELLLPSAAALVPPAVRDFHRDRAGSKVDWIPELPVFREVPVSRETELRARLRDAIPRLRSRPAADPAAQRVLPVAWRRARAPVAARFSSRWCD